jgi:hypothetical protein
MDMGTKERVSEEARRLTEKPGMDVVVFRLP